MSGRRRIPIRRETIRALTAAQLELVAGARRAQTEANLSCEPCPGDYTWFCKP